MADRCHGLHSTVLPDRLERSSLVALSWNLRDLCAILVWYVTRQRQCAVSLAGSAQTLGPLERSVSSCCSAPSRNTVHIALPYLSHLPTWRAIRLQPPCLRYLLASGACGARTCAHPQPLRVKTTLIDATSPPRVRLRTSTHILPSSRSERLHTERGSLSP